MSCIMSSDTLDGPQLHQDSGKLILADGHTDNTTLNRVKPNDEPAIPLAASSSGRAGGRPFSDDAGMYLVNPDVSPSAKAEARALPATRHADGHDSAGKAAASLSKPLDLPRDESPLAAAWSPSKAKVHAPPKKGPGWLLLDPQHQYTCDIYPEAAPEMAAVVQAASFFFQKADGLVLVKTVSNETASHQMAHQAADHGWQHDASAAKKLSDAASARAGCFRGAPAVRVATHDAQGSHSSQRSKQEPASLCRSAPASASEQLPAKITACSCSDCELADAALGGIVLEELREAVEEALAMLDRSHDLKDFLLCHQNEAQLADHDGGRLRKALQAACLDQATLQSLLEMSKLSSQECTEAAQALVDRVCATAGQHHTSQKPDLPATSSDTAAWVAASRSLQAWLLQKEGDIDEEMSMLTVLHDRVVLIAVLEKKLVAAVLTLGDCTKFLNAIADASKRSTAAAEALLHEEEAEKAARLRKQEKACRERKSKKKRPGVRTDASGQLTGRFSHDKGQASAALQAATVAEQSEPPEAVAAAAAASHKAIMNTVEDVQQPPAAFHRESSVQDAANSFFPLQHPTQGSFSFAELSMQTASDDVWQAAGTLGSQQQQPSAHDALACADNKLGAALRDHTEAGIADAVHAAVKTLASADPADALLSQVISAFTASTSEPFLMSTIVHGCI